MKARLYYFNKETRKQDQRAFDRVYRDLHCITRANDPSKLLADNALTMLTNLVSMLLASPNKRICINQDFLSTITGKESDQNSNLLKQLKDIISYQYHRTAHFDGKRYNYCYVIEFTQDGEERTSNPELFYSIDDKINLVRRGKKFGLIAEKIRASYISNIREIKREKEEEPLGNSSSFSPSIKTRAREAEIVPISKPRFEENSEEEPKKQTPSVPTLATGSMNEPAKVQDAKETCAELSYFPKRQAVVTEATPPSGAIKEEERHVQCHRNREPSRGLRLLQDIPLLTSLLNPGPTENRVSENEPIKNDKDIISMKASQIPLEPERNMMFELSGAIFKNFGNLRSEEIMEHCKFNLVDSSKLSIQLSPGYALSATDRESLKACIRSVYGEGINIVSSAPSTGLNAAKPETQAPQLALLRQRHVMWEQFRKELLNFFPKNTGQHILSAWFDKLSVKENKPDNTIILTGSSFYIDHIHRSFTAAIEHAVKKNKVALELHFENNDERPIIYQPNGGF